jgi:hypothetical protein
MSKPIARVAFFTLIALVLIAAAYFTVQGAFAKAETNSARAHTVDGLQTNLNHYRSSAAEVQSLQSTQSFNQPSQGHDCESEARVSPDD